MLSEKIQQYFLPIFLTVVVVTAFILWKTNVFSQAKVSGSASKLQTKPPVCNTFSQKFSSGQLPVWNGLNGGWLSVNLAGSGDLCDCKSGTCGTQALNVCKSN